MSSDCLALEFETLAEQHGECKTKQKVQEGKDCWSWLTKIPIVVRFLKHILGFQVFDELS